MNYLSVCSGIEAASVAWHGLGWKCVGFSEIEKFPSAVLNHRFPDVPNLGDMTKFKDWKINEPIDLLVGGTPCQAFSIAGLRQGLDDPRGNLTLVFLAMARRFQPRWIVWENVPGVLSDRSNAFGQFLAGLAELGYGCAYRVLDAQYFGVPQRRRRVFVVGYLGEWQRAAAVLFEPESLRGDTPTREESREGITGTLGSRSTAGGGLGTDFEIGGGIQVAKTLLGKSNDSHAADMDNYIAHTLKAEGFDASEDGTGRGIPLVCGTLAASGAGSARPAGQANEADMLIPLVCGALSDGAHMGGGRNGQDAYTGRIIPCSVPLHEKPTQ